MEHLRPEKDGRSWIVTPKGDGWVFERTYPTKWKASVAIQVWLQDGRPSDYFEAAREEKEKRRRQTQTKKEEKKRKKGGKKEPSASVQSLEGDAEPRSATGYGGTIFQTIRRWYRRFRWWRYSRRVRRTMREDMRWAAGKRRDRPPPLPPPPPLPGGEDRAVPARMSNARETAQGPSSRLHFALRYAPGSPGALAKKMATIYRRAKEGDPTLSHRDLMRVAFESRLRSGTDVAIQAVLDRADRDMSVLVEMILGAENRWGLGDLANDLDELMFEALGNRPGAVQEMKARRDAIRAVRTAVQERLDAHLPESAPRPWKSA